MRFKLVGFALTIGMALVAVLLGFTLLNAAGLVGFAATDGGAGPAEPGIPTAPTSMSDSLAGGKEPAEMSPALAAEVTAGDALFQGNCAQCHAVNDVVVGPALAGVAKRRPVSWLVPWIKNSGKVVASGDAYGVAIYEKYQKQQMPSFALSDKEIKAILTYLSAEDGKGMMVSVR